MLTIVIIVLHHVWSSVDYHARDNVQDDDFDFAHHYSSSSRAHKFQAFLIVNYSTLFQTSTGA